jgi:hypothetical protein
MQDKEFLNRVKIGLDTYIKSEIYEDEKIETLEEFVKWLYKEYGIVYNGQS